MAKIVFCEDEKILQKLIRYILRSTNHEIFMASDGVEGLAMIKHVHPDLIVTDISMPHCDGFQLARIVKAEPGLAAIPIVFMTAFAQQYDREEAARHGAAGYLAKPFHASELLAVITLALLSPQEEGHAT